jgi:ATP-dependent Clp protease ATP-binding subunit ClpA
VAATPEPTFERFTDRARHVVAASQRVAASLGADAVGTEHLLLALFAEPEGIAGRTLAAMNVTEDSVRAALPTARAQTHGQANDRAVAQDDGQHAAGREPAADQPAPDRPGAGQTGHAAESPSYGDDTKRALGDALAVALEFGHNYIGTEHLLLGLYRNADSRAAWILLEAGALEATARAHVTEMLRGFR